MSKKRTLWTLLGIMMIAAMLISACASATEAPTEAAPEEMPEEEMSFEGETVTIFTAAGEDQARAFQDEFVDFIAETGIEVVVEGSPDFEVLSVTRAEAGDPPEIYNFPQPGLMADLARDGYLFDLNETLGADYLSEAYNDAWLNLASSMAHWSASGTTRMSRAWCGTRKPSSKPPATPFRKPGMTYYTLSDQIVADGSVPWCIGIESATATGWPATDWVEDIMLRTTSTENYDKWTTGELKFNSPEVKNAFETMGNIFFNEEYVLGGTTGILTTNFGDAPLPLFDDPPSCFLHRQASFIPNFFPEGAVVGEDVDYFYLPPIDSAYGKPVLGSGSLLGMAIDTGATREVMKFLATPASVEVEVKEGLFVAPHNNVPKDWYPSAALQGFAEILENAETFRFDGSDLMPGAVGAGSFWTGVTDFVNGADLDTVLQAIDAGWPSE